MVQCLVDGMLQNITRLTRISLNQPPSPHQFDELMIGNRKVFGAVAAYHDDGHEEKVDGCDPMRQGGSQPVALGVVLVAGASNLPRRRQVCVPLHPPAPVSPSNPIPVAGGGKPESRSVRSIPCYPSSPDPSMPIFICPAPSPTPFPPQQTQAQNHVRLSVYRLGCLPSLDGPALLRSHRLLSPLLPPFGCPRRLLANRSCQSSACIPSSTSHLSLAKLKDCPILSLTPCPSRSLCISEKGRAQARRACERRSPALPPPPSAPGCSRRSAAATSCSRRGGLSSVVTYPTGSKQDSRLAVLSAVGLKVVVVETSLDLDASLNLDIRPLAYPSFGSHPGGFS